MGNFVTDTKLEMKPGFIYIDSHELKQIVAISKKTGWAYCQDGTKYSPAEVALLQKGGGVQLPVHIIKREFGGTLVSVGNTK